MLSGISIWQLLILLAIVVMVFGTKRLRNLGGDLGSALKDFRSAMKQDEDDDDERSDKSHTQGDANRVIDQDAEETAHKSDEPASHDRTP